MKNTMLYKGYTGTVEYSEDDDCLWGRVIGIEDIISYEGESVTELKKEFQETMDFYLEDCATRGKAPNKPFSGKITLNIEPQLQAKLEQEALESGLTFNDLVRAKLATV